MGGKGKSHKRRAAPEKETPPGKFSLKRIPWELVKIYIFFGVTVFCLFFALRYVPLCAKAVEGFTAFIAFFSSKVLNLFGTAASVSGTHLSSKDFGINIVDGCNGVFATAILLAGIVAYPSKIKDKLIGILIGIPAIFIINQLRVVSLFYLGRSYPTVFEEVHVYVWQPVIIIFAILVWDFWARNFVQKGKVRQASVSD
jgi:exosortase H (IPTLxxWG-CTERM-specific)